ncbi:MAG: metal-sensing transcriptional repressor [Candidatus Kerfeldbacteria bacterium]|nr:metal-sensing transcriptional repressor [Candidatus Kerfeldbacteria bacterium]
MKGMDSRRTIEHRLAIIDGHLTAIRKMLADGKPAVEVLRQSRAVQNALKKFDAALIEQYLNTSVAADVASGKTAKAAKELAELFELL